MEKTAPQTGYGVCHLIRPTIDYHGVDNIWRRQLLKTGYEGRHFENNFLMHLLIGYIAKKHLCFYSANHKYCTNCIFNLATFKTSILCGSSDAYLMSLVQLEVL